MPAKIENKGNIPICEPYASANGDSAVHLAEAQVFFWKPSGITGKGVRCWNNLFLGLESY